MALLSKYMSALGKGHGSATGLCSGILVRKTPSNIKIRSRACVVCRIISIDDESRLYPVAPFHDPATTEHGLPASVVCRHRRCSTALPPKQAQRFPTPPVHRREVTPFLRSLRSSFECSYFLSRRYGGINKGAGNLSSFFGQFVGYHLREFFFHLEFSKLCGVLAAAAGAQLRPAPRKRRRTWACAWSYGQQ